MAEGATDTGKHLGQIASEISHNGHDAAELDDSCDRNAGIPLAEQRRNHFEVGRAADGQKFSESLNDAQHKVAPAGLNQGEWCNRISHSLEKRRLDAMRDTRPGNVF